MVNRTYLSSFVPLGEISGFNLIKVCDIGSYPDRLPWAIHPGEMNMRVVSISEMKIRFKIDFIYEM